MIDDDDAPLHPLIAFTVGVVDGQVGFQLEYATSRDEYEARAGARVATVMTPENAIEIGKALVAHGTLAFRPAGVQPS